MIESIQQYIHNRFMVMDRPADYNKSQIEKKIQNIINRGYYQVSRKFRIVARFPSGLSGKDALRKYAEEHRPWDVDKWVDGLGEGSAGDYFLRCYAPGMKLILILTEDEFLMFRKLGGGCYESKYWEKENNYIRENIINDKSPKRLLAI